MIERKIVIGLITNTEYLKQIQADWDPTYIESQAARLLSTWVWEYFDKYKKAPMYDIENIVIKKVRKGNINEDLAEEIDSDILTSLSEEYEKEDVDITALLEDTKEYFTERQIDLHIEKVESLLDKGELEKAENEVENFTIKKDVSGDVIDFSKEEEMYDLLDRAFNKTEQNVVSFPGALGDFWNEHLARGKFVSFLAPEKRGKTFWLLEFMMRAYRQGKKVIMFQAGDMTDTEFALRVAIYLAKRPESKKFCGTHYIPVQDCIKNQTDTCARKIRECDFGVFVEDEDEIRKELTKDKLIEAYEDYPDYKPCYNCVEWTKNPWGSPWIQKKEIRTPLTVKQAKKLVDKFFIKTAKKIKLSVHDMYTLDIRTIKQVLDSLIRRENFHPDLILIDYADLLVPEIKGEFRHQQNDIWMKLRGLSQSYNALVVSPTQADSLSYEQDLLMPKNFSEDKRKYGHVTAMWGMNQDKAGREKKIGVMRFNRLVLREGDFHYTDQVHVLSALSIGRPFLGSFY
ncbi:MAG: hypothetical protein ACOC2U_00270 [bacterium]